MTITIDTVLASRLQAMATARGEDPNRYANAVLAEYIQAEERTDADWYQIDKALEQGISDADARRLVSVETLFLRLESHLPEGQG